jgi:hypothetical protein
MKLDINKALLAYSLAMAAVVGGLAATNAVSSPKLAKLHTIDVQRINVREPDGTLRMVFANTDRMPGIIIKGKEWRHASRRGAGVLFFNDEGTENGGFGFSGSKDKNGVVSSGGNIAFDQYMQDQVLVLNQQEHAGRRSAGLQVNDRPDHPMDIALFSRIEDMPDGPEKAAQIKTLRDAGEGGANRVFLGKDGTTSAVTLNDAKGKPRLMLSVDAAGVSKVAFLDEAGKTVRTLAP